MVVVCVGGGVLNLVEGVAVDAAAAVVVKVVVVAATEQ